MLIFWADSWPPGHWEHWGCAVALTGPTGQPSDGLKPLSFLLSSASWKADYFLVWIFPPWDLEKLQHTRVSIFDLKFLQVFFKYRGEILVFLKNVEFLEFFGFTLCFTTFQAKKNFRLMEKFLHQFMSFCSKTLQTWWLQTPQYSRSQDLVFWADSGPPGHWGHQGCAEASFLSRTPKIWASTDSPRPK